MGGNQSDFTKNALLIVEGVVALITTIFGNLLWFGSLPKTVEEAGGAESGQTNLRILTIVLSVVGVTCGVLIARWLSREGLRLRVISLVLAAVVTVGLYFGTTIASDRWSTVYKKQRVWTGIWIEEDVRKKYPTHTASELLEEYPGYPEHVWPPNSRLLGRLIPSTLVAFLLAAAVFTIVLCAELLPTAAGPGPPTDAAEDDAD